MRNSTISARTPYEQYENAQQRFGRPPWGNCLRGCPPAYLDKEGFCSPACKLGFPRGEYVTLPNRESADEIRLKVGQQLGVK